MQVPENEKGAMREVREERGEGGEVREERGEGKEKQKWSIQLYTTWLLIWLVATIYNKQIKCSLVVHSSVCAHVWVSSLKL